MKSIRWQLLVVLAFGLAQQTARADQPSDSDGLAIQAQDILDKHCRACHSGPDARAGLNVFDRKQLLDRRLINLRVPESSELLDLVESGSMPPGTHRKVSARDRETLRRWIAASAP